MNTASDETRAHIVRFYEDDRFVIEQVSRSAAFSVKRGNACVLVATRAHMAGIEGRLGRFGVNIELLREKGTYLALDASETLAAVMVNGFPDETRFERVIGGAIAQAMTPSTKQFVWAFGEMVALLCAENNSAAAIRLEELWNVLLGKKSFSLCCAYPLRVFANDYDGSVLLDICTKHTLALPAETPL